ncbi:MAG: hypothetical protein IT439_10550 [Phycisphaerales bacterium]|nr:hypothetical protein [Phycisphaerales bacterium]
MSMAAAHVSEGPASVSGAPLWSRVALRWMFMIAALLVIGPLAGRLTGALRASDGSHFATPLTGVSTGAGLIAGFGALALALLLGAPAGRMFGPRFGLKILAFVLLWAAWRTGPVDELLRTAQSDAPMRRLGIEALVLGLPGLAAVAIVLRLSRSTTGAEREEYHGKASRVLPSFVATMVGAAAGAAFGGWLVAIEPLKGQAVAAACFGGIAAGAAGRLAGSMIDDRVPPLGVATGIVLVAVLGPWVTLAVSGSGAALIDACYAGRMFPLGHIEPLDWLAGGVLGMPVGIAWAGSMMSKGKCEGNPDTR